jgi:hypothetical protein
MRIYFILPIAKKVETSCRQQRFFSNPFTHKFFNFLFSLEKFFEKFSKK